MKPALLHRDHLRALAAADLDAASKIRVQLGLQGRRIAVDYLRAAVAVCLESSFGPGAGLGAGPIDYEDLAAFMAEVRAANRAEEPPPDHLAVEAVIRSLYGEPHLIEPLSDSQRSRALYLVLRHQLSRYPWLGANFDAVIERARQVMTAWVLG